MIKKLQQKIVIIITVLLTLSLIIVMLAINVMSQLYNNNKIKRSLERLAELNGMGISTGFDPYHASDYIYSESFAVKIGTNGSVEITINQSKDVDKKLLIEYANQAFSSGNDDGYIGNYAYLIKEKVYGVIVVFIDVSTIMQQNNSLFINTLIIGGFSVILFFLLALCLSFWLVHPVKVTFDKQKLFISNASHELKTPIAVINANADVLKAEIGDNKWLAYIKNDSERLNELVNELLSLARLEDKSGHKLVFGEFNLSELVLQTALPFESRMFELGKKYETNIQPDIKYRGDKSSIKHILTILIDNAIKYSDENGEISVKLYTRSGKKIIEVYNTGIGIPSDKLDKVFERFYRVDEVRNGESGGYGLGLSIASEIVKRHKGSISVQSEYGKWAEFIVTL